MGKKAKTNTTEEIWNLRLYLAGQTPKSIAAFANLKKICDEHLTGKYTIEVIDLLKNSNLAKGDQIIAIPILVRKLTEPIKKLSAIWLTQSACWWGWILDLDKEKVAVFETAASKACLPLKCFTDIATWN